MVERPVGLKPALAAASASMCPWSVTASSRWARIWATSSRSRAVRRSGNGSAFPTITRTARPDCGQRLASQDQDALDPVYVVHPATHVGAGADAAGDRRLSGLGGAVSRPAPPTSGRQAHNSGSRSSSSGSSAGRSSTACRYTMPLVPCAYQVAGSAPTGANDTLGDFQIRRHVFQSHLGQQLGIVLTLLALSQDVCLFDQTDLVGLGQAARIAASRSRSIAVCFALSVASGAMVSRTRCGLSNSNCRTRRGMNSGSRLFHPQLLQQRDYCPAPAVVRAVNGWRQRFHQQVQAIRKAVAGDFPFAQFQLVQGGVHRLFRYAIGNNLLQYLEHQGLDGFGMFGVEPPVRKRRWFAGGGVEAAQRRGRGAQFRGFQGIAQRRAAVVQQHIAQRARNVASGSVIGPSSQPSTT